MKRKWPMDRIARVLSLPIAMFALGMGGASVYAEGPTISGVMLLLTTSLFYSSHEMAKERME